MLEIAAEFGVTHIDLQPDVRPRRISECLDLIDVWARLDKQVDFAAHIETHRHRNVTTDRWTESLLLQDWVHALWSDL